MRIFIWGTGFNSKYITDFVKREKTVLDISIGGYIDNASEKWGSQFEGCTVYSPAEIKNIITRMDYIVICALNYIEEIRIQCMSQISISSDKILSCKHFFSKAQYMKRYQAGGKKHKLAALNGSIAVYTANFGFYDDLQDPEYIGNGVDYFCFTDNEAYTSDVWKVKYINNTNDSPEGNAKLVRHYKFFPEEYLPEYEISIWVDSKYKIIGDLRQYISRYSRGAPMLSFPHFLRDCIFDEASACMRQGKGNPFKIQDQINHYHAEQYPHHYGLYENGCLVRWQRDSGIKKIMSDWWKEVNQYSLRDQISLPYVFWKNDFMPDICDLDIEENEYLIKAGHRVAES